MREYNTYPLFRGLTRPAAMPLLGLPYKLTGLVFFVPGIFGLFFESITITVVLFAACYFGAKRAAEHDINIASIMLKKFTYTPYLRNNRLYWKVNKYIP